MVVEAFGSMIIIGVLPVLIVTIVFPVTMATRMMQSKCTVLVLTQDPVF